MNKKIKFLFTIFLTSCAIISNSYNNTCIATDNNSLQIENEPKDSYRKIAYITIDDGPSKYTDEIISILDRYNAKATFFMIDSNMRKFPQQVKNIIEKGHTPGLHSVSHDKDNLYKTNSSAKEEFDTNRETFYEITGTDTMIVRLPYGSKPYTPRESYETLVKAGYKMWDWGLDTKDWKSSTLQIVDSVETYAGNRNEIVVLMHERYQTVQALDDILSHLKSEGYELVAITQEQDPQNFWLGNLK